MRKFLPILLSAVFITGCSKTDNWTLTGEAPEMVDSVYIQAPARNGSWYDLDTTAVNNGKYAFSLPKANGTIYRLKLGGQIIYIPADSTETIIVSKNGTRSGSENALLFNRVDSLRNDSRELLRTLDGHYASTAAYYATRLNKDFRLLRTIANRFNEERPRDSHTAILLADLKALTPKADSLTTEQKVIFAEEISYYDIELMDRNGNLQKLSDVVDNNPLTILAYVDFTNDDTPAVTRALGDARSEGAEIYEIGFAENQHLWSNHTEGLPWVCVYQSDAADRTHINQYAVAGFPTFFIFKNGEITDRVNDYKTLTSTLQKYK